MRKFGKEVNPLTFFPPSMDCLTHGFLYNTLA